MGKVKEITVVFLMIDSDDWFAYPEERPHLHARGKQAFCKLHGVLEQYELQRCPPETQPPYRYIFNYRVAMIPF